MKNNQTSPALRALILGAVICIPLLFVLVDKGTSYLFDVAPYAIIAIIAIGAAVYTAITSGLLYQYYESEAPWYRWLPCYGELVMMDGKYLRIGTPVYIAAVAFLLLSFLPYSITGMLGTSLGINFPMIAMGISMLCFAAIQVIKGLGMLNCMKVICDEWEEHTGSELGLIKSFSVMGFIPFIRVMAVYSLNKPLSTLVQFNNVTVSDSETTTLTEE